MSLYLPFRGESVSITPNGQSLEMLVFNNSKITKKAIQVEFASSIIDVCSIPSSSRTNSLLPILVRFSSGELGFINELNLQSDSAKCQLLIDNNNNTKLFDADTNDNKLFSGRMNCVKISSNANHEDDGTMFRLVTSTNTKLHYLCFILQNNVLKGLVKHDYTVKFENDDESIYQVEFAMSSSITMHSQIDFIIKTRNRTNYTQRIFPLSLQIQQQQENNSFFSILPVPFDSNYFEFVANSSKETKYHQLCHNSRKIGIAVALTNPFLISVYSHKSIIGTVPLPVKYRNASCAYSSLRRRGDEASATMSAIYWSTQQIDDVTEGNQDGGERKNSSLILVTVVYEDFDTATVICLSLKNVPSSSQFSTENSNNYQTNQNNHYYVEMRGTWNLSLRIYNDALFRHVEKVKMEVQSETESSSFREYKQRILRRLCGNGIFFHVSSSKDPHAMFILWMTLNDENINSKTQQQFIQRFDLIKSNEKDSDDDGLIVGSKNIYFGSFSSSKMAEPQRREENINLVNAQEVMKQKHQQSLLEIEHPPATSLFEYSFPIVVESDSGFPSSSSLLVNFHRELLEVSCWKRKTIDQLQSKQGEKYQRAIHQEEMCRIFLPSSAKINSVKQVFDEKGNSVFQLFSQQQSTKVFSCCFIVDDEKNERFVVVMIFHAELGAQLIPLAQFTKVDNSKNNNSEKFQLKSTDDSNISLGNSTKNEVLLQIQRSCTGLILHPFSCNL